MADLVDWARTSPLVFLLVTLLAYQLGLWLRTRTDGHPVAQPVLVAVVVVGALVLALDVDYTAYRSGTELIAFWLGPATVALAIPLHRNVHRLRGLVLPLLLAIALGALASLLSAWGLVLLAGGEDELARTMSTKSTTTPVSIALSETIGGIPALSAVFSVIAGIFGAVAGPTVLSWLRIRDERARGLALGSVSHGIGTSRALHESETEGAFAGLGMGLTALATSLWFPLVVPFL
jgi:predicted murein hydrolase (TIGR00659 family)